MSRESRFRGRNALLPLPLLIAALDKNDAKAIADLMKEGAAINVFQDGMDTPLVTAIDREAGRLNMDFVKLLLGAEGFKYDTYSTWARAATRPCPWPPRTATLKAPSCCRIYAPISSSEAAARCASPR
jgi:hypothetical protein